MTPNPEIARRTALVAGLGGLGTVALAACANGTSSGGGPASGGASSAGTAPAAGQRLARLDDITVGQAVAATLDGQNVLVARPTSTTAVCFSAVCTHMGCTVAPAGRKLACPCHGSVFDAVTGDVVHGPAQLPLNRIAVAVRDGEVVTTGSA